MAQLQLHSSAGLPTIADIVFVEALQIRIFVNFYNETFRFDYRTNCRSKLLVQSSKKHNRVSTVLTMQCNNSG
jgi:hypothetical protein